MSYNVEAIRKDFPNLHIEVRGKPLVYLDNAATTFKPQAVIDVLNRHYSEGVSNVHRGVHFLSEQATLEYEDARATVRQFINADNAADIIFTRGTTESINIVAQSYGRAFLEEGDEILITAMEHHSNIVPWQMLAAEKDCILKVAPINDDGEIIWAEFENLLTDRTKIVAVVHVSNSLGTVNPVKAIALKAHEVGAVVLVDGAQSVSHSPVDVTDLDCDFFVFSSHKLFGPTGVGVLYGRKELLERMPPVQGGGDMIASVTFEKTTYNILPYKFEAGTPHIAGVIGLAEAIRYVQSVGLEAIGAYKKTLLDYATKALSAVPGLRIIGTAHEKSSVVSFVFDDIHAHDIGTIIDQEGVAIRTGHHCTQPVMQRFGIPATSRASLSMYNTKKEIDVLVEAIDKAKHIFK